MKQVKWKENARTLILFVFGVAVVPLFTRFWTQPLLLENITSADMVLIITTSLLALLLLVIGIRTIFLGKITLVPGYDSHNISRDQWFKWTGSDYPVMKGTIAISIGVICIVISVVIFAITYSIYALN